MDQGEGSGKGPLDADGEPAHFYRFAEIVMGSKIVVADGGYSFPGGSSAIVLDESRILPMTDDPTLAAMQKILSAGDFARCTAFAKTYTAVLDGLQATFAKDPKMLRQAVSAMDDLADSAADVLAITLPNGRRAGLCFERAPAG